MKKITIRYITTFAAVLVILASLSACDNIFSPSNAGKTPVPAEGKGYVQVQFSSSGSRTILPKNLTFAGHKFTFTPTTPDGRKITYFYNHETPFELEEGDWELEVIVYSETLRQTSIASTASPIPLTVDRNTPVNISVPLVFSSMTGTGTFIWQVTNNTGVTPDQVEIILESLGTQPNRSYMGSLDNKLDDVAAGYYLATIRFEKDIILPIGEEVYGTVPATGARRIIWNDILHIYPGQTTTLSHTLEPTHFFNGISEVWIFGDMTDWSLSDITGKKMIQEADGTFSWKGDATAGTFFRFSLTDTHDWHDDGINDDITRKKGAWFVPVEDGDLASIGSGGNTVNFIPLHTGGEAVDKAWKLESKGYYEITLDPVPDQDGMRKFYVERPVIVESVTVNGPNSIKKGTSTAANEFTATVTGKNNPAQTVTWSIVEENIETGTTINSTTGILSVDSDESVSPLTIMATSTVDTTKFDEHEVTLTSTEILSKVSTLNLSTEGIAEWSYTSNDNVTEYSLQLYKGTPGSETKLGSAVTETKGTFTHSFLSAMRDAETGVYSFTVTAIGDNTNYATSDESDKSNTQEVTQRTAVQYTWWYYNYAQWDNTDESGEYQIELIKNDVNQNNLINISNFFIPDTNDTKSEYDFSTDKQTEGVGLYTFRVLAKGDGKLILDAEDWAVSSDDKGVTGYSPFGDSKVWTIVEGGGRYVAGADGGKIAWSTDGTHWTLAVQSVFTVDESVRGIAYSLTDGTGDGRFVAVGYNGKTAYSDNGGKTWTEVTSGFGSTSILSIAYGNGTFVAGGDGGNVRYSINGGTTWLNATGWNGYIGQILDRQNVMGITFGGASGNEKFVAVGGDWADKGDNTWNLSMIAYSDDGNVWNWSQNLENGKLDQDKKAIKGITFGNGTFVVIREESNELAYCTNPFMAGSTWTNVTHQLETTNEDVAYGGGQFLIVGGNGRISKSANAATWTAMTVGEGSGETQFNEREKISAIGFGGGKFILHGNRYPQWGIPPDTNHNANMGKMAVIE